MWFGVVWLVATIHVGDAIHHMQFLHAKKPRRWWLSLKSVRSSQVPGCVDAPAWEDADGDGCGVYAQPGWCGGWSTRWANQGGLSAAEACCVCGGGHRVDVATAVISGPTRDLSALPSAAAVGAVAAAAERAATPPSVVEEYDSAAPPAQMGAVEERGSSSELPKVASPLAPAPMPAPPLSPSPAIVVAPAPANQLVDAPAASDIALTPAASSARRPSDTENALNTRGTAPLEAELKRLRLEVRERDAHIDDLRGMLTASESELKERDSVVTELRADLATADKVAHVTDNRALTAAKGLQESLQNISNENAILHRKERDAENASHHATTVDIMVRKEEDSMKRLLHNATDENAVLHRQVEHLRRQNEDMVLRRQEVHTLKSRAMQVEAVLADERSTNMGLKTLVNQTLQGVGGIRQLIVKAESKMRHVDRSISALKLELGKHAAAELSVAEATGSQVTRAMP